MKFFLKSIGCRFNQTMAQHVLFSIANNNDIVDDVDKADTILLAGCVVTQKAEAKFRRLLDNYKKKYPHKRIILSGCLSDYIKEHNEYIEQFDLFNKKHFKTLKTRQMIIIQTGCNQFCSYCIVPYKRGMEVSRNIDYIIEEIKEAERKGIKEIVLTGIHIGKYRYNSIDLYELLNRILQIYSGRVRLSSLDINELNDELLKLIINNKNICSMIHLSIQHTENGILSAMKRNYKRDDIDRIVNCFSNANIRIGADLIVGFPGESDTDFNNMYNYIKNSNITHFHIFRYSLRNKTLAAYMQGHIEEKIKRYRMEKLNMLANKKINEYRKGVIDKIRHIIIENIKNGYSMGITEDYLNVKVKGEYKKGTMVKIKVKDTDNKYLIGDVL